jgi:hypothetical protein
MKRLIAWVEQGGTLIAIGNTAHRFATSEGPSRARRLRDALEDLHEYELQVLREFEALTAEVDASSVFGHDLAREIRYPWTGGVAGEGSPEERKRRDAWLRTFSPQGAMLAARTDQKHWLTFGLRDQMSVLYAGSTALLTPGGVETPVRLGVFDGYDDERAEAEAAAMRAERAVAAPGEEVRESDDENAGDAPERPTRGGAATWSATPEGRRVALRMSGLLWPEAAARLANAAYLTRESRGAGQIILFADDPVFRGSTLGTARALMNAIVYGPGAGTRGVIQP